MFQTFNLDGVVVCVEPTMATNGKNAKSADTSGVTKILAINLTDLSETILFLSLTDLKKLMLLFRSIRNVISFHYAVDFLKRDVEKHGGTASETISIHGQLYDIEVSSSPWGPIVIQREVTRLEALSLWYSKFEGDI